MKTCDVDRIEKYNFPHFKNQIKFLLGLKPKLYPRFGHFKELLFTSKILLQEKLGFTKKEDPYWNFEFLRKIEKKHGINSCYYFLHKDVPHIDSYYDFNEKKIKNLIKMLEEDNCEIGIHGSVKTVDNVELMKSQIDKLNSITSSKVIGCRQHRLTFHIPDTMKILEKNGVRYDTSLGFAEHEGFRNSYCHPFKLFDFENDRMIDVWEFPLNMMDRTLLEFRNLTFLEIITNVNSLLDEIEKFNGLCVILWHNSFWDSKQYPGIINFYEKLHEVISSRNPFCLTGKEIVNEVCP
jgi:hypothetical protein